VGRAPAIDGLRHQAGGFAQRRQRRLSNGSDPSDPYGPHDALYPESLYVQADHSRSAPRELRRCSCLQRERPPTTRLHDQMEKMEMVVLNRILNDPKRARIPLVRTRNRQPNRGKQELAA
jgi:hypothetical protein